MPFIPTPNTARVAITYRDGAGNEAVNVIHVNTDELTITPTVLGEMADVIEAWLDGSWSSVASTAWRAVRLELLDLTSDGSWYLDRTIDVQGNIADDAVPSMVTIAMSLRSNLSGRSRRGRLYHVGLAESQTAGDYVPDAQAVFLLNAYNQLRSDLIAEEFSWCVVSYVGDGVPRTQGMTTDVQSVVLVDLKLDRQNRRRPQ